MPPTRLLTLCYVVLASALIAGCQPTLMPESHVTLQGEIPNQEEIQPVELNNCDGKLDLKRVESRNFSVSVTVSQEIAASVGASAEVISAEVQKLVGDSLTTGAERTTSIELAAPPHTNMRFELVWSGSSRIGVVQNYRSTTLPIAFSSFVPTDVNVRIQYDLGCGGDATAPITQSVPTSTSQSSEPVPTATPFPPTPSLVFETIPLNEVSELSYPQDNLGLGAGRQTLVGIPFDFGWTSSTQCSYIPGRPTQIDLHMDVPNPINVYVLLQAGWGTQQYAGKEIGAIELRFFDGTAIRQPLVLGTNIRDWSVEDTGQAVNTATSPSLQEAWTGKSLDGRQGRMDLLTIPVSDVQGGNLKQITITDETQQTTGQMDPCIHLLAVTILHFQEPTS